MKIVFDIDGTLTDYNGFVQKRAVPFFVRKYNMEVTDPNALEIEDVFEMKKRYLNKGMTEKEAEKEVHKVLNRFWFSHNVILFFTMRFRKGVKNYIRHLKKEGHEVEFHTSRAMTCEAGLLGKTARTLTRLQFLLNGVSVGKKIFFYENDEKKIEGILEHKPSLLYDDKREILEKAKKEKIGVICVSGVHNREVDGIPRIASFEKLELQKAVKSVIGERNLRYFQRDAKSNKVFQKIKRLKPIMMREFRPVILNADNIDKQSDRGIVYAPNHRSTWDPIIITGILGVHIHWAALLRFFQGKDSIFNNSKNPILCKITSVLFKKLEYFPIDRKTDNSEANNLDAIRDMNHFLKVNARIGIFAEGTTRRPEGCDFGAFDESFILLAKRNKAVIQPVTVTWIKDKKVKNKIVVNFGKSFVVENMSTEEAMERFMEIQKKCMKENEEWIGRVRDKE